MIGVRKREETKKGAPAYIVSFSALMTIMLTFFILMCTMANEQEAGLLAAGTGSFIHNINAFGLPGLLPGHRTTVDLGEGRPQFAVPRSEVEQTQGTDADLLYRRVIALEPVRLARALAQYFNEEEELRFPLDVHFEPGSARLTPQDRKTLWPLVRRLRMVPYYLRVDAYVSDNFLFNQEHENAWELSAARAAAVVQYFREAGGISYRRMRPVGHGSTRPLVHSPAQELVNDRVELVILKY